MALIWPSLALSQPSQASGLTPWIPCNRDPTSVWSDVSKNVILRNPSKKMGLDESFQMVPVSCHLEVVVKSYDQITKITSLVNILNLAYVKIRL